MTESGTINPDEILRLSESSAADAMRDRAIAVIVGGAIADSMGWITEFMRSPDALKRYTGMEWLNQYVSWPKRTGGRFNTYVDQINAGDYSDDTQLTLCVARCIGPDGRFDAHYFTKVELPLWIDYARGAGSTINGAARAAKRKSADWFSNFFTYKQGGQTLDYRAAGANGVAMRVAPLAIANCTDKGTLQVEVWRNAVVTHGHPRAIVGALVMAEALRMVLDDEGLAHGEFFPRLARFVQQIHLPDDAQLLSWRRQWDEGGALFGNELERTKEETTNALDIAALSRSVAIDETCRRLGCFDRQTKGSGVGTVAAALALFYRFGGNFRGCVEQAVNMVGTDTDTIGAMAGQLAAAHGGVEHLPEDWTVQVQDYNYLSRVGEELARIGCRDAIGYELSPMPNGGSRDGSAIDLSKATQLSKGQRISHPLFGLGWVRGVQSQEIRRANGGMVTLVDVEFDMGQSIRMRSHPGLLKTDKEQFDLADARTRTR